MPLSVLRSKRTKRRDDGALPVLKRETIMGMLQELQQRGSPRGYQSFGNLMHLEEQEKAQTISNFLSVRYHDIYGVRLESDSGDDDRKKPVDKPRLTRSQSKLELAPVARRPSLSGLPMPQIPVKSEVEPLPKEATPPAVPERKFPPLYHKMKAIWTTSLMSKPSEEEWVGLPVSEHTVRSVFGIDVYEARGIAKAFPVDTVESLYQLYTKERIHGREGHMRELMQKAVFSPTTCNRIMALLKQIDAFSIFLDTGNDGPETPLPPSDPPLAPTAEPSATTATEAAPAATPAPAVKPVETDGSKRHMSLATSALIFLPPMSSEARNRTEMVDVYLSECARLHVFPSKKVLALLDTPTVELGHFHIGKLGTIALLTALHANAELQTLDVSHNFILAAGGAHLCALLEARNCPRLAHLALAKNRIGTAAAARLLHALSHSQCPMESLDLSGNEIHDRHLDAPLAAFLATTPTLTRLNLSDNQLRDPSARAIATALSHGSPLTALSLAWNAMTPLGATALVQALAANKTLETFDLSWNRLGHVTGCVAAVVLLRNKTLRAVDLSSGQLSALAMFLIADALHYNVGLDSLQLDQNAVDDDGMRVLLRATQRRAKPLALGLNNMVYEAAAGQPPFNPLDPAGCYVLALPKPEHKAVFELLRMRAATGVGSFHNVQINGAPTENLRRVERIVATVSTAVALQFDFVLRPKPARSETVHFRLDLANERDRATARTMLQRASAEHGHCWRSATLDGAPVQVGSAGTQWLDAQPQGILELAYGSSRTFCEKHYKLDLANSTDRAVAYKLLERVERSRQVHEDRGDAWRSLVLDGTPIELSDWEKPLTTRGKWKWRVPTAGVLEFDFYTPQPHHVLAKHYRLDLASPADRHTAHELRVRSYEAVGECWWNEEIDGYPFHLPESPTADFDFPRKGILELDFLVLRPAHYITSMSMDDVAFDLSNFDAFFKAELLRRLAIVEPHDYFWTNISINSKIFVRTTAMLPAQGKLAFTAVLFRGLAEPASADAFELFCAQVRQARGDPDLQRRLVAMACGPPNDEDPRPGHEDETNDSRRLDHCPSSMVQTLLAQVEAKQHQAQIFDMVLANILDKPLVIDLAIQLESNALAALVGVGPFAAFQGECVKAFLHARFNPGGVV
ncbi:hypothetical protein ACHHYP_12183 [Achlya hypogyna]|uniref:Uncharacterized protein n=1 Tax=Achlya hypogyna TaxID=1202772 RepID=A0A1V9YHI6_ACHHY|nr:hypothetical protein ACHHYP_12183 [Achlya hypogyna]